jgi:hypothetical protein
LRYRWEGKGSYSDDADDRPIMYTGEIRGVITRSKYLISVAKAALSPKLVEESDTVLKKIIRQPVGVVV